MTTTNVTKMVSKKEKAVLKIQKAMDDLMERIKKEDEDMVRHLADGELIITNYTCADNRTESYKVSIDAYTAYYGYDEKVIIETDNQKVAEEVYENLHHTLKNNSANYDDKNIMWIL